MKKWKLSIISILAIIALTVNSCENENENGTQDGDGTIIYPSYEGLVMAGYQGWFNTPGDGASGRNWNHYDLNRDPPSIDFWPDITEYTVKYEVPVNLYKMADGSKAYVYSPYDESSVDLHFKWMKDYGIDGVFMQRFVREIDNTSGRNHFNKVLDNALKAAKKYGRAIGIMYDLSGCTQQTGNNVAYILTDWQQLITQFKLNDPARNPTYVHQNGKPILAIWGIGFNDGRQYTTADVQDTVTRLKNNHNVSIMLGVPYWWRRNDRDCEGTEAFYNLVRNCDIIMPWAVGRYDNDAYGTGEHLTKLTEEIQWCNENDILYVPLVFPGFSWANMQKRDGNVGNYHEIPRDQGNFLWKQIAGAKAVEAKTLYVAMFDEIDEGTAIFKCAVEGTGSNANNLPVFISGGGKRFVGIEEGLQSDYYLWLVGQAANWFHGNEDYNTTKPAR